MPADERLIAKKQRNEDEPSSLPPTLYFPRFLEALEGLSDYQLVLTPKSKTGYIWYSVQNNPSNGFKCASSTKTQYLVPVANKEFTKLHDKLLEVLPEEIFNYATPIFAEGFYDHRSKICKAIQSRLKQVSNTQETLHSTRISQTHPAFVSSFIPELQQFPQRLIESGLTYTDFLCWLYDTPEQEMMALHIGRASTLPQGGIMAGETEPVSHSYRNILILQGAPKVGKSWFNNWLIKGFQYCGLHTSVIHDLNKNFGHAQWVSSAWSYADDTTESMVARFFDSAMIKTVASNGLVNVESKGIDHTTVKAFTTPILLANNIDSRNLAFADEGNANRIKIVVSKTLGQLKQPSMELGSALSGIDSLIPARIVTFLCEKFKVSEEVLCTYFLRLCLDYFESFSLEALDDKIVALSNELKQSYITGGLNIVAKAAVLAYLLKNSLTAEDVALLKVKFHGASLGAPFVLNSLECLADLATRVPPDSTGLIKNLIKQDFIRCGKSLDHCWMVFLNYDIRQLMYAGIKARSEKENLTRTGRDIVPLENIYNNVFKGFNDVSGNSSFYSVSRVQAAWSQALGVNFEGILDTYRAIVDKIIDDGNSQILTNFRDNTPHLDALFKSISDLDTNKISNIPDDYYVLNPIKQSVIHRF